jgi:small redox-active disulfide protein 2
MKIKILGMGCSSCQQLEQNAREALRALNMTAEIEKVTAVQEILAYQVMTMPVLVIDEQVCVKGQVASVEELKVLLKEIK